MSDTTTDSDPEWLPGDMETGSDSGSGTTSASGCESDEDKQDQGAQVILIPIGFNGGRKRRRAAKDDPPEPEWSPEEEKFIAGLSPELREKLLQAQKECSGSDTSLLAGNKMPLKLRVLLSNASPSQKQVLLQKIDKLQSMDPSAGEFYMLQHWVESAVQLPLGVYHPLPIQHTELAPEFLQKTRESLDAEVFGHSEAKNQILRILAQWIANPSSKGNVIGIYGGAGVGKTTLVKEGISKALGLPFAFMALGGASDGAFLEGHAYTYQGSTYGRIADALMKAGCMNPVIFMDELDKVSDTPKGQEVSSILMHLTDSAQNERFADRYFADFELDLSKALFVFSYNDPSKVSPILLDRMIQIRVPGYSSMEKRVIARDYMIPKLLKEFGLTPDQVIISDVQLAYILEKLPHEDGVRSFKRALESILSWVNMLRFTEPDRVKFPFTVETDFIDEYIQQLGRNSIPDHVLMSMYT